MPPEPSLPTSRVRLTHRVLTLDGDQLVGVSVGGAGVPLVFLHGFGLNRRAYLRLLSRLGGLGFLVIAPDAAGHGETPTLPRGAAALEDRVRLTLRTLDVLGVRKAVFVGHSMGGRMIIDLAAHHPERVLAAVLLNAAAGAPFDESILTASLRSPRKVAGHLLAAAVDAQGDPARLTAAELVAYLRVIAGALGRNVRAPRGLSGALHAIIGSGDFSPLLAAMRRHRLPTIVVHGEKDGVVPFANAHDMAERADATLYRVPGAHHSWMLTEPRQAADMMRQLLDAELGWALRRTAADERIGDDPEAWQDAMLRAGSPLREHTGDDHLGTEPGRHVDLMRLRSSSAPPRPLPPRRLGGRLVRRFARLSRAAG